MSEEKDKQEEIEEALKETKQGAKAAKEHDKEAKKEEKKAKKFSFLEKIRNYKPKDSDPEISKQNIILFKQGFKDFFIKIIQFRGKATFMEFVGGFLAAIVTAIVASFVVGAIAAFLSNSQFSAEHITIAALISSLAISSFITIAFTANMSRRFNDAGCAWWAPIIPVILGAVFTVLMTFIDMFSQQYITTMSAILVVGAGVLGFIQFIAAVIIVFSQKVNKTKFLTGVFLASGCLALIFNFLTYTPLMGTPNQLAQEEATYFNDEDPSTNITPDGNVFLSAYTGISFTSVDEVKSEYDQLVDITKDGFESLYSISPRIAGDSALCTVFIQNVGEEDNTHPVLAIGIYGNQDQNISISNKIKINDIEYTSDTENLDVKSGLTYCIVDLKDAPNIKSGDRITCDINDKEYTTVVQSIS